MDGELRLIGAGIVVLMGLIFGYAGSRQTFEKVIGVSEVSIPPRFLVRQQPFVYGRITFILFCLGAYVFALVFYRQLPALVSLLPEAAQSFIPDPLKKMDDSLGLIAIAAAITVAFLHFLESDFKGNFIYRFREIIYSSMSVPFACQRIQKRLLNAMAVPHPQQTALAALPGLGVAEADFSLPRDHIARQWAELAAMHEWVEAERTSPESDAIFADASFGFEKSHNRFVAAGQSVQGYKGGAVNNPQVYVAIGKFLDELRSEYARYVACLLLSHATTRQEFYAACERRGINLGSTRVASPLNYSALYLVTLMSSIVLGPYLCAVGYDLNHGKGLQEALSSETMGYIQRWLIAGFGTYFSPIFFVLLIRNLAWRISPERKLPSLVTYAWILLGAFAMSLIGGISASVVNHWNDPIDWGLLGTYTGRNAPWSIGPSLISVYINYYLDRQADPAKEDIDQTKGTILARLMSAIGFTAGIVLLTLLIVAAQHFDSNLWSEEKTRFIVVGTVTLITFCLCLVAQFGLVKRPNDSDAADA
ncbi:hypothetical protein BF49_1162 [Bradyrhizobium sp.]|uniref:hypothetical protein n=1 Tax=Bradyrhizobium sp. TaxID=376 RepID=UPI0007C1720E|nr:hypothetical protein [Bradyrhizobium sp.]CUT10082.1 hypothetical protein BF49_1162 [Bradyrhizobium sp.]